MADSENYESLIPEDTPMETTSGDQPVVELPSAVGDTTVTLGDDAADNDDNLPFQEEAMEDAPARTTYIDYLKSPVIGLLVGNGGDQALLTAHQALLTQSPWFADTCAKFSDDVSVCRLLL
jgi:hypothetical protein